MSDTIARVRLLVGLGEVRISAHGYDELADDDILATEVLAGVDDAILVEDYPTASRGPSVLVRQEDSKGRPLHVVWGIPAGRHGPAVLVTAYRPDATLWTDDFLHRKKT